MREQLSCDYKVGGRGRGRGAAKSSPFAARAAPEHPVLHIGRQRCTRVAAQQRSAFLSSQVRCRGLWRAAAAGTGDRAARSHSRGSEVSGAGVCEAGVRGVCRVCQLPERLQETSTLWAGE